MVVMCFIYADQMLFLLFNIYCNTGELLLL